MSGHIFKYDIGTYVYGVEEKRVSSEKKCGVCGHFEIEHHKVFKVGEGNITARVDYRILNPLKRMGNYYIVQFTHEVYDWHEDEIFLNREAAQALADKKNKGA